MIDNICLTSSSFQAIPRDFVGDFLLPSALSEAAILSGTSAHSLGKFAQTKGAEGSSENVGSAREIVYTGHFIRAGFFFLVQVPILPVLGLPFQ